MTVQSHVINNLKFQFDATPLSIDPVDNNIYHQVSSFLLPQIEDVFDSPNFQDYEIKIDKLDLNIGVVFISDGSLNEVASKLRKVLYDELCKRVDKIISNPNADEIVMPRKKAEIMTLFIFLKSGILSRKYFENPENLLDEILKEDSSSIIDFLFDNSDNLNIVKRLVWQFKPELIEKIIQDLVPSERVFIKDFLSVLKEKRSIDYQTHKGIDLETEGSKYHRQILEFTLNYCLLEKSVQFNRINFVQSIISRISNHYNISFDLILFTLIGNLEKTIVDSKQRNELKILLYEIVSRNKLDEKKENRKKRSASINYFEFLHAIDSGNSSDKVNKLWNALNSDSPKSLREFLYTNCQSIRIIRNLVLLFNNQNYTQCIKLLCDTKFEYVEKIILVTQLYITSGKLLSTPFYISDTTHSLYVREFVLKYFICNRDGIFSDKVFTRTILKEVADHYNLSFESLLYSVVDFIKKGLKEKDGYIILLKNLTDLLSEVKNVESSILMPSKKYYDEIQTIELYENLLSFLFDGISGIEGSIIIDSNNLQAVINRIKLKRPDLINLIFEILRKDQQKTDIISRFHPVSTIQILIETYLSFLNSHHNISISLNEDAGFQNIFKYIHNTQIYQKENYLRLLRKILSLDLSKYESSDDIHGKIKNLIEECFPIPVSDHDHINGNETSFNNNLQTIPESHKQDYDKIAQHKKIKQTNINNITIDNKRYNQYRDQCDFNDLFHYLQNEEYNENYDDISQRLALENIIINNPQRLRHFMNNIYQKSSVLRKITALLSENMFFRLLHILNGHSGMAAYNFYIFFNERIYSILNGNEIETQNRFLKAALIKITLDDSIYNTSIKNIIDETTKYYSEMISENGLRSSANIVLEELIKSQNDFKEDDKNPKNSFHDMNKNIENISGKSFENTSDQKLIVHDEQEIPILEVSVLNAGIVLGAAYFERLFSMLHLTRDKKFANENDIQKALRILYHFASDTMDCHEYELTLAKVLCGLKPDHPIDPLVEITQKDKEVVDSLVDAIIKNWSVMKNTSRDSFRQSFLQRKGYLSDSEDGWLLKVEKRAFDMLIDTLPWGFSMIKFPWMDKILKVEWNWK